MRTAKRISTLVLCLVIAFNTLNAQESLRFITLSLPVQEGQQATFKSNGQTYTLTFQVKSNQVISIKMKDKNQKIWMLNHHGNGKFRHPEAPFGLRLDHTKDHIRIYFGDQQNGAGKPPTDHRKRSPKHQEGIYLSKILPSA